MLSRQSGTKEPDTLFLEETMLPKNQSAFDASIRKLADEINTKRQLEINQIYSGKNEFDEYVGYAREHGVFEKGNKSKSMRKIASFPVEVDQFFTKVYGDNYYKDPDFFKKYHNEWAVIKNSKL